MTRVRCDGCDIDFFVDPIGINVWRIQRENPPIIQVELQDLTKDYVQRLAETKKSETPEVVLADIYEAFNIMGESPFCVNCGGDLVLLIKWSEN